MMVWQPGVSLEAIEKMAIEQAFKFYRGNKTQTASSLGIAIRTLDNKLEKYDNDRKIGDERNEALRAERQAFIERSKGSQPTTDSLHRAATGTHVESTPSTSSQPTVSVQERKEVQEVLQGKTTKSRTARGG